MIGSDYKYIEEIDGYNWYQYHNERERQGKRGKFSLYNKATLDAQT